MPAPTLKEWLAGGGKSLAWFERLPDDLRARVQSLYESGEQSAGVRKQALEEISREAFGRTVEPVAPTAQPAAAAPAAQAQSTTTITSPTTSTSPPPSLEEGAFTGFEAAGLTSLAQFDPFNIADDLEIQLFRLSRETQAQENPRTRMIRPQGVSEEEWQFIRGPQTIQVPIPKVSVGSFINTFSQMSPQERIGWQKDLEQAGLLQAGRYTPGYPDTPTYSALMEALGETLQQDKTLRDVLRDRTRAFKEQTAAADAAAEKERAEARRKSLREMEQDQYRSQLLAGYFSTWALAPPPGYIDAAMKRGVNVKEFVAQERAKPSFRSSPVYQEERLDLEARMGEALGSLG